jgi:hypothetical protein
MSVAKLLLSGLLVASGLILGAFTLHGYFDPEWLERQAAAAGQRSPAGVPKWSTSVDDRNRVMSIVPEGSGPSKPAKPGPNPDARADARADAKPPSRADADAEKARRRLAAKKLAEKRKAEEAQKAQKAEKAKGSQQATFQWPWNWLGN